MSMASSNYWLTWRSAGLPSRLGPGWRASFSVMQQSIPANVRANVRNGSTVHPGRALHNVPSAALSGQRRTLLDRQKRPWRSLRGFGQWFGAPTPVAGRE